MSGAQILVIGSDFDAQMSLFADGNETAIYDAWGWYVTDGDLARDAAAPRRDLSGAEGYGDWFTSRRPPTQPLDHVELEDVEHATVAQEAPYDAVIVDGLLHVYDDGQLANRRGWRVRRHPDEPGLRRWLQELLAALSPETRLTLVRAHI